MRDQRCALRLTRRYDAEPAELWRALTEPESVVRWLGAGDVQLRPLEPERVLELELADSVARIELTPDGDRTILVLDHERIPAEVGMRFAQRWTEALDRFRREVAG
jgi:hypothetical protein